MFVAGGWCLDGSSLGVPKLNGADVVLAAGVAPKAKPLSAGGAVAAGFWNGLLSPVKAKEKAGGGASAVGVGAGVVDGTAAGVTAGVVDGPPNWNDVESGVTEVLLVPKTNDAGVAAGVVDTAVLPKLNGFGVVDGVVSPAPNIGGLLGVVSSNKP